MSTVVEPETVSAIIASAIKAKSDSTPRTRQAHEGRIGPSDLGFCAAKAVLMTKGTPQSDSKSAWPANVGTAIHEWVEDGLRTMFPTWLIEQTVTATFACGATVSGHCDLIIPEWNMVLDIKTVDGFESIKRFGTSRNHKWQRHTYALGAIEAGLIDTASTVYVGNVYLDRSGQEREPYVVIEEIDWMLTDEINAWIESVIDDALHGRDGLQEVAAPVCEKICEFFSVCRGTLPERDPQFITDPDAKNAIRMYAEAQAMERQARKMKDQARDLLVGFNGSDGEYQVRWTTVGDSEVPGFTRRGYDRLDVTPIRRTR